MNYFANVGRMLFIHPYHVVLKSPLVIGLAHVYNPVIIPFSTIVIQVTVHHVWLSHNVTVTANTNNV